MIIPRAAWLLAVLVACSGKKEPRDECAIVKGKLRPVFAKMGKDLGKPLPDDKLDEMLAGACDVTPENRAVYDCVVKAAGESETAACLEVAFRDYQNAAKVTPVVDAAAPDAAVADAEPMIPIDAAPEPPAAAEILPFDLSTLPEWAPPAGDAIAIYAVDMDADLLLTSLLPKQALLAKPAGKRVTGTLVAPSEEAAFAAVAAAIGVDPTPAKIGGKGATVDLSFGQAPVADVFRFLADTGRVSVVAPGELGTLDIVVKRKPWDGVLAATVAAIGRTITKVGPTMYVLPPGTTLPALPKLSGSAAKVVISVTARDATLDELMGAFAAVAGPLPIGACGATKVTMALKHVPLAEALRAVSVLSGAALVADPACPSTPLAVAEEADATLVASVTSGATRAAAFDVKGAARSGIAGTAPVTELGDGYALLASGRDLRQYPAGPVDDPIFEASELLARAKRTAALIRRGTEWMAYFEIEEQHFLKFPDRYNHIGMEGQITVGAEGVHVNGDFPGSPSWLLPLGK